jgi:WD repeat-containing protein 61
MDGTVAIFDAIRGKLLHHLEGHSMAVRSLAFSRVDPNVIFTACDDKHVRMFDAKNNGIVCAMSGHGSWVLSVDSSPDGSALASGSSDRTVRLWDLSMRASIQTVADHSDHVWGVAFRPPAAAHRVAAARLASVSDDKSINLYDFS